MIFLENDRKTLKSFSFSLSFYFTIFIFVFSITLKIVKISKTIIPKSKTTIFLFIPSQRRSHSVQCLFEPGMHMLTPIRGQHMITLEYVARSDAPCSASARPGQTGLVGRSDRFSRPVRPVLSWSPTKIQRTLAREGPCQGKRTLGCSRLGRPARASSNAMETREE